MCVCVFTATAAARIHLLEGDGRLTGTLIYAAAVAVAVAAVAAAAAGVAFARYLSWESLRLAFSITTRGERDREDDDHAGS